MTILARPHYESHTSVISFMEHGGGHIDLLCPDVHLTYMGYQLHTNYLWRVTYQPCVDDEGIEDEEIKGEVVELTKTHQRMGAGAAAEF